MPHAVSHTECSLRREVTRIVRPEAKDHWDNHGHDSSYRSDRVCNLAIAGEVLVRVNTARKLLLSHPLLKLFVLVALHREGMC